MKSRFYTAYLASEQKLEFSKVPPEEGLPKLNELLDGGYGIKMVNNIECGNAVYSHYILERKCE